MNKLILVSTCTNNKTARVPGFLVLQNCNSSIYDKAIPEWTDKIWSEDGGRMPAVDLYAGSHWKGTLKAHANLSNREDISTDLWILSAGCGLIPSDLEIPPYSATFSSGADGIHELIWQPGWSPKEKSQHWWKEINAVKPKGIPRSLPEIDSDPESIWLFILSKEYMPAVENELFELVSSGRRVLIASAGAYGNAQSLHPVLQSRLFPLSEKFEMYRKCLHGAKVALNANFAHWLTRERMDQLLCDPDGLLRDIVKIDQSLPDPTAYTADEFVRASKDAGSDLPADELEHLWTKRNRQTLPMTDEEVLAYIDEHYEPGVSSATQLLRKLRHEELRSCEQKRFGALFKNYENRDQLSLFED
jgi:hypothetical protein